MSASPPRPHSRRRASAPLAIALHLSARLQSTSRMQRATAMPHPQTLRSSTDSSIVTAPVVRGPSPPCAAALRKPLPADSPPLTGMSDAAGDVSKAANAPTSQQLHSHTPPASPLIHQRSRSATASSSSTSEVKSRLASRRSLTYDPDVKHQPLEAYQLTALKLSLQGDTPIESNPSLQVSTMEEWNGRFTAPPAVPIDVVSSPSDSKSPVSRLTKRRQQQASHKVEHESDALIPSTQSDSPEEESTSTLGGSKANENTLLSPSHEVDIDSSSDAQSAEEQQSTKKCYKKKRVMIPVVLVSCLIVAFLIALAILYPKTPTIRTNDVSLSNLTWRSDELTGRISANLTLTVSVTMENHNRFGAHFAASPIDVVLFRDEVPQPVTTMHLPSGYIGPHSTLDLLLSSDIRETELSGTAELLRLAQHMQVAAQSEARGTVRLIGIEVPWKVRTRCEAECTLNLWSMEVAILRQQCESHAD